MTIGKGFPTGRSCDGLLILDHIAEAAGLPYTNPYENSTADHSKGVNFAVGGTGVLSKALRRKWNVTLPYSNSSIDVQLRWFDHFLLDSFKNDTGLVRNHLGSSLFIIGGGGNDYAHLPDGKGNLTYVQQKERIMPDIMRRFKGAIERFIKFGATKIIVTGVYQGGCLPNSYQPDNKLHCHNLTNQFHMTHNHLLQKLIQQLTKQFPGVNIVYGDVWSAAQWIFDRYPSLGFKYPQKACCGDGNKLCGFEGSPYCKRPSEHIFWDQPGHFTHAAYQIMFGRACGRSS
ncbi:GDSL esterase/lipase At1g28670 [Linum perenne]